MITRRDTLQMLAGVSVLGASGCCTRGYPAVEIDPNAKRLVGIPPYLKPKPKASRKLASNFIVDSHAHFFNASDVPVKDFIAESIGHDATLVLRILLKLLAPLAEQIAKSAPTAAYEMESLTSFELTFGSATTLQIAQSKWDDFVLSERTEAARRVAEVTNDSKFIREYYDIVSQVSRSGKRRMESPNNIAPDEVLAVIGENERLRSPEEMSLLDDQKELSAEIANGVLGFLFYMLSMRSLNISAYKKAFTEDAADVPISCTLGALVDFDYWLDCPPMSSHEDQIALHKLLSERCDYYMRPLVAYNPWTDIKLAGEGLSRVQAAMASGKFAGVKIYPPMGFFPSDNKDNPVNTRKKRPNLEELDAVLGGFFEYCKSNNVPVMSHTSHSNGRDKKHDDFGGPKGWARFLAHHDAGGNPLRLNFGHFGSATHEDWTQDFAKLIKNHPRHSIYADLGFWDSLACSRDVRDEQCGPAQDRLKRAIGITIGGGKTVADRTLFGTDWLMLSRTPNWPAYPKKIFDSLESISDAETAYKVFGKNAMSLFDIKAATSSQT